MCRFDKTGCQRNSVGIELVLDGLMNRSQIQLVCGLSIFLAVASFLVS